MALHTFSSTPSEEVAIIINFFEEMPDHNMVRTASGLIDLVVEMNVGVTSLGGPRHPFNHLLLLSHST